MREDKRAPISVDVGLEDRDLELVSTNDVDVVAPTRSDVQTSLDNMNDVFNLNKKGLWCLAAQHFSSTWGDRCSEFAFYLFLIVLFPSTLLPASLYGFFTTSCGVIFSPSVGGLVDRYPRLNLVRTFIVLQKISSTIAYAVNLVLFVHQSTFHLSTNSSGAKAQSHAPLAWVLFGIIVLLGTVLKLSTVGIQVAIERDWATTIAGENSDALTKINTVLRRIDLISKLVAPLFVSLLTSTTGYRNAAIGLLAFQTGTLMTEFFWISVVYTKFPSLQRHIPELPRHSLSKPPKGMRKLQPYFELWLQFIHSSIFPSSLAIALLYMTVLSFDGTLLSYLKTHKFSDAFLAAMRAICVVAGLGGTFVMPWLEKKVGVIRAGLWSIWTQIICLVPVLLTFFIKAPPPGQNGPVWGSVLLFGGLALSRIGLWAFDLAQLKQLQTSLQGHTKRNALTALQYSLQNIFDLAKYVLTIILHRPSQFKWAVLVSFISVFTGGLTYTFFAKRERGHILHWERAYGLLMKKNPS
ncbi:hypothetical protein BT69DRAFT_1280461 [Atractiella rhizophila]|nr:hypothetical protein BT69DRAFT_1280461 [Atractiella rhizophila]